MLSDFRSRPPLPLPNEERERRGRDLAFKWSLRITVLGIVAAVVCRCLGG